MEGLQGWLYQFRFWYDQLYLVPLSFSILLESFATTAFVMVFVILIRNNNKNTQKVTESLDRIAEALKANTDTVNNAMEESAKNFERNHELLEQNHKMLEPLSNMVKQWDWKRFWVWR